MEAASESCSLNKYVVSLKYKERKRVVLWDISETFLTEVLLQAQKHFCDLVIESSRHGC